MATKKIPCEGCEKPISPRKRSTTNLCLPCWKKKNTCVDCGRIKGKTHLCSAVHKQPPRFCLDCKRELKLEGKERGQFYCTTCTSRRTREKDKAERANLKQQFGGKCFICGYKKCQKALHFHHLDSSEKKNFKTNGGATPLREIKKYPERFRLLCANCHIETHDVEQE